MSIDFFLTFFIAFFITSPLKIPCVACAMQGILLSSPPAGVGGFSLDKSRQKNFWGKFVVAWRRRGVTGGVTVCTARRRGLPFAPAKGSKTGSRGRFPLDKPLFVACSAGYERCEASSVLRTDTLQRCLRRIFIAPALERGRANHHPCPLLKGGGLRCKLSKYFRGNAVPT